MAQLIFVLLDGLSASTKSCMSYMCALEEAHIARYCHITCEVPSLSRPIYATMLSGRTPIEHGIVHNATVRRLEVPTVFEHAQTFGLTTAAAAYYWMSELCNIAPYVPLRDRFTHNTALPIQHGIFYHQDAYPDEHLFLDAECLRLQYKPDILLVHTMGIDDAGHRAGLESCIYRNAVRLVDMLLAQYMPRWLDDGANIIVTSDHGMHKDAQHNDTTADVRDVPFWLAGAGAKHFSLPTKQTYWANMICQLLSLPPLVGASTQVENFCHVS